CDNEGYEGTELKDKLDVEILLWLFKFQQRYQIPDIALEALIKFLNNMLMMIDDSKFCEFPTSLFIVKKKLGIFQPKLRMA
ncbi:27456_t:CDS:1, partial [Dentiscutata erythropus]